MTVVQYRASPVTINDSVLQKNTPFGGVLFAIYERRKHDSKRVI